jgi:hypothetical protein
VNSLEVDLRSLDKEALLELQETINREVEQRRVAAVQATADDMAAQVGAASNIRCCRLHIHRRGSYNTLLHHRSMSW